MSVNEIPGVSISSYPTLKFYPAINKKNPVEYKNKDREIKPFISFIRRYSRFNFFLCFE